MIVIPREVRDMVGELTPRNDGYVTESYRNGLMLTRDYIDKALGLGSRETLLAHIEDLADLVGKLEKQLDAKAERIAELQHQLNTMRFIATTPTGDTGWIDDGFGTAAPEVCPDCKERTMYVVRPGDIRCARCEGGNMIGLDIDQQEIYEQQCESCRWWDDGCAEPTAEHPYPVPDCPCYEERLEPFRTHPDYDQQYTEEEG